MGFYKFYAAFFGKFTLLGEKKTFLRKILLKLSQLLVDFVFFGYPPLYEPKNKSSPNMEFKS